MKIILIILVILLSSCGSASIPFSPSKITDAKLNEINSTSHITVTKPIKDLPGLSRYLLTSKGSKITSKNVLMSESSLELTIGGVKTFYFYAKRVSTPKEFFITSDGILWAIDKKKLKSFFLIFLFWQGNT